MDGYKSFSIEDYNQNDLFAKKVAADFLVKKWHLVEKIPVEQQKEKYKLYDIILYDPEFDSNITIETQVCNFWDYTGTPRFKEFYIPYRKNESESNLLVVVNKLGDSVFFTYTDIVKNSEIITRDTQWSVNEKFFSVKYISSLIYIKKDNDWTNAHNSNF